MSVLENVRARYSEGAQAVQEALCCPVDYDRDLLHMLPQEIIERDYGCGDPSRYVRAGDHVLDLGSGGGKICYMAAQLVGADGLVTGVDMNEDMLALARAHQQDMAEKIGGDRVRFLKGYIQDLSLDLEALELWLTDHPVGDLESLRALEAQRTRMRKDAPLVADASQDLVISNCVLNLVENAHRQQLIAEIYRVVRPGGRVAISDIVADRAVPPALQDDPELWSGCISGAFEEHAFLDAFKQAGFVHVAYDKWQSEPWRVVGGIEFRSVTLTAVKPVPACCARDLGQAAIYLGPYQEVRDDLGNVYPRGRRMAVSDRSVAALQAAGLLKDFVVIAGEAGASGQPDRIVPGTERPAGQAGQSRMESGADGSGCC